LEELEIMQKILLSTALLALMACSPAAQDAGSSSPAASQAEEAMASTIHVQASWMRPHPVGRDVTAAYFTADLATGSSDRLVGARIDGADHAELHGHTMDPQTGMMQMEEIGPQDLAPGAPLVFAPGGRHVMVFGLAPVVEGETVSGVLVFERAGEVPVTFDVRSTPAPVPADQN
jgi:copper(I)-binding protein